MPGRANHVKTPYPRRDKTSRTHFKWKNRTKWSEMFFVISEQPVLVKNIKFVLKRSNYVIFWIPKKTELEVNIRVSNFKDSPKKSNYSEINLKMIVLPDFVHVFSV